MHKDLKVYRTGIIDGIETEQLIPDPYVRWSDAEVWQPKTPGFYCTYAILIEDTEGEGEDKVVLARYDKKWLIYGSNCLKELVFKYGYKYSWKVI
jgi:hypothetical protein